MYGACPTTGHSPGRMGMSSRCVLFRGRRESRFDRACCMPGVEQVAGAPGKGHGVQASRSLTAPLALGWGHMYLTRFSLQNIRAIEALEWEVPLQNAPGWHVILGDNGSGK